MTTKYTSTKKKEVWYGQSDKITIENGRVSLFADLADLMLLRVINPHYIRAEIIDKKGQPKDDKLKIVIDKNGIETLNRLGIAEKKIVSLHTFLRIYVDYALKRNHFANDKRFDGITIDEIIDIYSVDHLGNNRLDNRPLTTSIEPKLGNAFLEQLRQGNYCITHLKNKVKCKFMSDGELIQKYFDVDANTTRKQAEAKAKLFYIRKKVKLCQAKGKFSKQAMKYIYGFYRKAKQDL
jgi:hypothetical protein